MATAAATTSATASSAAASSSVSSSSARWLSQSSRNFGERALPPPPRTFTPPPTHPVPRIPEYNDELLVSKVEALVGRALPSPPTAPTPPPHQYEQHHENIYEEITDDFILKALQRNKIKMAQKSVPNSHDDYGFVCQTPELLAASDPARKLNQNQMTRDMQTMLAEDTMIIPPDAKYNGPRASGRSLASNCFDISNLSQEQLFGFVRGCTNDMSLDLTAVSRAESLDLSVRSEATDTQRFPPPPSYSQSQNFLPHCHPAASASQPEHYMCMTAASHVVQSSSTSLNTTSVLTPSQQHSTNPPLPPKMPQQSLNNTQLKSYETVPPPPSYPGCYPALPPRQTSANPGHHRPPPDYNAHLNQRPPLPNPRSNPMYPPNYPSNLLPSQSVPNLNSIPISQMDSSSSLLSSVSSSSQSQIFYTPGAQPPPRLRPCHTPTETDPTWCPYGSRPPSSLYMSDSSATYSAGSDSGISVCSERGHPLAASMVQTHMRPDHQHARTDLDCSRIVNQMGQYVPKERRHSWVNLNESRCSDYLAPACVHGMDEGFSEWHCYHQHMQQHQQQQLHQQQMQQHQFEQQQQIQQQQIQQQQIYEQHLQKQQLQKQIQEQRLQQLHEQHLYKQHLQLQQQQKQEELRLLQQQMQEQQEQQLVQQQEGSNFVQRAREKIYQKLKHLDLAHPDYNQLEFSPVPWSPPPSEAPDQNSAKPPPLPPPREPAVFKSISLSKGLGLQHLDPSVLTPSKEVPPPLPARLKRVHLSRKPLPVVPQENEEDLEPETKSCDVFGDVKPIEYKGDDIIGITGGLDRLQVFHRQQGARKVIPRAHSTDTESEYGSRANSRDMRASAKDKRPKADSRTKSKESRTKSREARDAARDSRSVSKDTTREKSSSRACSSDRRSQSRRRRAKSLDKRSTLENKERSTSSSSSEAPPPPPLKTRHSSGSGKASRPPPLSVRNVSDPPYEERSPGVVNGTLSELLRWNHDRILLV